MHSVNVMGVVHGILSFVPRMIEGDQPGHVVNTSSGDGGISPSALCFGVRVEQGGRDDPHGVSGESARVGGPTKLRASIFYPSGGLLKTGLWESEKTRPADLAREVPRTTEPMTVAKLEAMAEKSGHALPWQDLNELGRLVVDGIKSEKFIFMKGLDSIGSTAEPCRTLRDAATWFRTSAGCSAAAR